jgi:hypothetical protein
MTEITAETDADADIDDDPFSDIDSFVADHLLFYVTRQANAAVTDIGRSEWPDDVYEIASNAIAAIDTSCSIHAIEKACLAALSRLGHPEVKTMPQALKLYWAAPRG